MATFNMMPINVLEATLFSSWLYMLHEAVKQTDSLSTLEPLYKDFFKEMDNYMMAYEKLKRDGKV